LADKLLSYEGLIQGVKESSISKPDLVLSIALILYLRFPDEGLSELLETMRDIHWFHERKAKYQKVEGHHIISKKVKRKTIARAPMIITKDED